MSSTFTLAQRSTVERIVFGSSLDADAIDPLSLNYRDALGLGIRSLDWATGFGGAAIPAPGATLAAGGLISLGTLTATIPFNLISVPVSCGVNCSLVLVAGTYQIFWGYAESLMPTYTVKGESVVSSNPYGSNPQADTSLVFQVQGVSAVPEPQAWALMLAGLAGVVVLRRRQAGAAGHHVNR